MAFETCTVWLSFSSNPLFGFSFFLCIPGNPVALLFRRRHPTGNGETERRPDRRFLLSSPLLSPLFSASAAVFLYCHSPSFSRATGDFFFPPPPPPTSPGVPHLHSHKAPTGVPRHGGEQGRDRVHQAQGEREWSNFEGGGKKIKKHPSAAPFVVNFQVVGQDSNEIHFRVKMSTQMGKLKKSYSERVGVPVTSLRSGKEQREREKGEKKPLVQFLCAPLNGITVMDFWNVSSALWRGSWPPGRSWRPQDRFQVVEIARPNSSGKHVK